MDEKSLNYWMYRHACLITERAYSDEEFEGGYVDGRFNFLSDPALLGQLVNNYGISLHRLSGEWLALGETGRCFGEHPLEAVCKVVVLQAFGAETGL